VQLARDPGSLVLGGLERSLMRGCRDGGRLRVGVGGGHDAAPHEYDGGPTLLQPWVGALVFAAYTAIVVLAGSLAFVYRDPA
jgi:hypothetical protein